MLDRRNRIARRWVLGLALWLAPIWLACQPAAPVAELPPGPLLAGSSAALVQILDALEQLESTPLARDAARARQAVAGCREFVATPSATGSLFEASACSPDQALSDGVKALRGDAPLVFVLPLGGPDASADSPRLSGRIHVEADASLRIEARLDRLPDSGLSRWLVPADASAGAPRLATRDALVQGRFRPRGGLDLASLVPAGSQADLMFRLKSELFVGAALGDAWEFSIYLPASGASMPPMALALDVRDPVLAKRGAESFVAELEGTWPLHARPVRFGEQVSGACFDELRIMPEFAPCYAVTRESLVFAWNAASLELAIASDAAPNASAPSRLVAHLARFPEADARLWQAGRALSGKASGAGFAPASSSSEIAAPHTVLPFDELEVELRGVADDAVSFLVRLGRAGAP